MGEIPEVTCACGERMILRTSRHGPYYRCARWPKCDYRVGAHREGEKLNQPLGTPADAETRKLRKEAHKAFDPVWTHLKGKARGGGRKDAYQHLARRLGIPEEECHIGMFDADMCRRVIEIFGNTWPDR